MAGTLRNFQLALYSSLNIFCSSFLHLIIEKTNVFFKIYHILGFLNFLYLPQITK